MSNFSEDMDGYQWENHFKTLFTKHEGNADSILAKLDLPQSRYEQRLLHGLPAKKL